MSDVTDGTLTRQIISGSIPVWLLDIASLDSLPDGVPQNLKRWIDATGFAAKTGETSIMAASDGSISAILLGLGKIGKENDQGDARARCAMIVGKLARSLPTGNYHLEGRVDLPELAALSWRLGGYTFDRYLPKITDRPSLAAPSGCDLAAINRAGDAVTLTRDLINTPANDLGPEKLEEALRNIASTHKATVSTITGDRLLQENFPMIHAVGRASNEAPRLLDLSWGNKDHAKITLVGKGVSFDTGGLNIKPGSSMGLMKKDMGGAANVMGLAMMIMSAKLPVRLRVLIPAVENSISGNAFRPGDILPSRNGMSVEIGNTDAEGRLVLADALTLADEEAPDYLIDMATLTGAARVALGPDLPPFYTHNDVFAEEIAITGMRINDPLWRMPLWLPYDQMLSSKIADVNHITAGGFAGSVTAALFLARFVERAAIWAHFDIFAWVPTEKPWAPVGGEAQAIRTLFEIMSKRYPK